LENSANAVRIDLKNFRVMSAAGDSGREDGDGNIDANDPNLPRDW
jgi:hypothetical protein